MYWSVLFINLIIFPDFRDINTRGEGDYTMDKLYSAKMKHGAIHLYLGPVNDYCISQAAKQLRFWNEPMVTAGQ